MNFFINDGLDGQDAEIIYLYKNYALDVGLLLIVNS